MSEEKAYNVPDEYRNEEVAIPAEPLFEGTADAELKSIGVFVAKDRETQVPTGLVKLVLNFSPTVDLTEAMPREGTDPRVFFAGSQRLRKEIAFKFPPNANAVWQSIEAKELKETARALGLKVNGVVKPGDFEPTIGAKVTLKLSVKDEGQYGFKQQVYVKRRQASVAA